MTGTPRTKEVAQAILRSRGPMLTGELASALAETRGMSKGAACQAVSRLPEPIQKLDTISFPDNQKLVYLPQQYGTEAFRRALHGKLIESNAAGGRALEGILGRGGWIPTDFFPIAAGAPVERIKRQLAAERVREQLLNNGLLNEALINGQSSYLVGSKAPSPILAKAISAISELLLDTCLKWAVRLNLGSSNTITRRTVGRGLPQFGLFAWDLVAPCYLNGLRTVRSNKLMQGYFVADAIINDRFLTKGEIASFTYKLQVARSQKNSARFIPALIHLGVEKDALYELRKLGVMTLDAQSFGDKSLGELLTELLSVLSEIGKNLGNPERLQKLIERMLNAEYGRLLNLPGPLFQITLAYLYKLEGLFVEPGKLVTSGGGSAEIDLFVQDNAKRVVAIESKGYKRGKSLDKKDIAEWIEQKRARIAQWYQQVSRDREYRGLSFKFIISSKFREEEKKAFEDLTAKSFKQFPVEFLDVDYVVGLASKHAQHEIVKGLREYFGA